MACKVLAIKYTLNSIAASSATEFCPDDDWLLKQGKKNTVKNVKFTSIYKSY